MKHSIWFRLAKSLRKGQAILHAELQQDPGHVLNVIHGLAYGVPLSMAALNNGAKSQISTFLQRLNFHRQDISCHSANIVAENGYKSNFDYYPCRDALGPTNHFPSPLMGEDKEPVLSLSKDEGDNWAGRSRAIGLRSQLSSPLTGVPSPLDGEV